jgi:hypothetical protein
MATTAASPSAPLPSSDKDEGAADELTQRQNIVIQDLVARAESKDYADLPDRPLDKWFNSVQVLSRQADLHKEQGRVDLAYILTFRTISLGEDDRSV